MVWVSRVLLRKYGRFMDDLRIYVRGGTGGMGFARLGGEGGKGGDVWLVAQENVTLKRIKARYPSKRFIAGTGVNSSIVALKGAKGKDCEVHVPPGISVTTDDGEVIGELYKVGDRMLVAHGGIGGCVATNFFPVKGQKYMVHLDLKLIADVGLVGFPNAGKSSLLAKISHATPEVADYAFTTIQPELGTVMYADHKQVDVSGFQLSSNTPFRTAFETIVLLAKELELYKEEFRTKPALLAINKMDLPNAEEKLNELKEKLQSPEDYMHLLPKEMIPEATVKFREIIPISAHTGEGTEELIMCLRNVLDEDAEKKIENSQKEKLRALHHSEI
ncbi:GTP-binding protein 10 isoform X2 [Hemicordylus capensis]|uniref:GTP-binding protein 10 isoform X2 n=1 Tax=Hemicordylus capensis TaxID=884348 RepID=UPI0023042DC4|nr:GTP-binding protein 10 isoform X2 [Hemicordylus capensis]